MAMVVGVSRSARVFGALCGAAALLGAGCGNVAVTQEAGTPPDILSVQPSKGPSAGGTPVVITGHGFAKGATVRFGGELASAVTWLDDVTLTALTPEGAGAASVSVENPDHLVDTLDDAFAYEGVYGGCTILSSIPDLGEAEVPVVGSLRVSFSAPLDAVSVQGAVKLQLLGGEEVPADVKIDASTGSDLLITPKKSLRFWSAYAVIVGDSLKAGDGSACSPGAVAFATIKPEALPRALRPAPISGLALVGNVVIAASEGYRGLQMYDVSSVAGASLKGDLVTRFGPRAVVVRGSRAYAPSGGSGVQIFDVTEPQAPVLLGHGGTPGRANDVAVMEKDGRTYLLVADVASGVRVLDATDPAAVVDKGVIDLGGGAPLALAIDAQGDRVAVVNGGRVALLEVADPANAAGAKVLGGFDVQGLSDVLLDGDHVFVTKSYYGAASYDISDPAAAKLITAVDDPDGPCGPGCLDVAAGLVKDGSDLFVAFGRGGVTRFSVSASGALAPVTTYKVPGDVRAVAATASSVFVGGEEGMLIFDRAGDGAAPAWFDPNGHGLARGLLVKDGHAYVGASVRGVQTFSLADPEAPALVDRDDTPASLTADVSAYGVAAGDKVLAVGDGRAGITLFDLSNPADPALGGTVDTIDGVTNMAHVGSIAYACNGNAGVVSVDTTEPSTPKLLGSIDFSDVKGSDSCGWLTPADGVMYVARAQGLGVLDISDPTALAWKALVTLPSKDSISSVQRVGSHLLVTSGVFDYEGTNSSLTRLHVFDASEPASPKLVWSSDDLGGSATVSVAGDIAFVSAGGSVKIFDISDIERPALEGSVPMPGNVSVCAPGAGVLYAAQGAGGLQAIFTGPLPSTK